ncbi:MAG: zinc-ribbon domain-containing protein [Ruminococcus sp.]|nr:zinc-ribbon domain-containing protein [Ruminococcus sp.]
MYCKNCGEKLVDNANFCLKCGEKCIKEDDAQAENYVQQHEAVSQPTEAAIKTPTSSCLPICNLLYNCCGTDRCSWSSFVQSSVY